MEIDCGSEQYMGALAPAFGSEQRANLLHEFGVPSSPQRDSGRNHHARCSRATVAFSAYAVRAVGHLDLSNPGVRKGLRTPGGLTGKQQAFLVEGECIESRIDIDHGFILLGPIGSVILVRSYGGAGVFALDDCGMGAARGYTVADAFDADALFHEVEIEPLDWRWVHRQNQPVGLPGDIGAGGVM